MSRRPAASAALVIGCIGCSFATASRAAANTPPPSWSSIAAVTRDGRVVTIAPDGSTSRPMALEGVDPTDTVPMWDVGAVSSTRVLVSSDYGQHVLFDAATGESSAVAAPAFTTAANAVDGSPDAVVLLATLAGSESGVLVDLTDGSTVPIPMAPAAGRQHFGARGSADGATVAVTDINADRTHVVVADSVSAVVPGVAVAVAVGSGDGPWVSTVEAGADETVVWFHAADGTPVSSTALAGQWVVADGQDGTVVAVNDAGDVTMVRPDGTSELAALARPTGAPLVDAFTTMSGDRLVVQSGTGFEVFDRAGALIGSVGGGVGDVLTWPRSSTRCITATVIGDGSVDIVVLDTATATIVSTDRNPYSPVSHDGCTFRETADSAGVVTIVHDGTAATIPDATSLVAVSPDGSAAFVQLTPDAYRIVDLDAPDAPAVAVTTTEWLTGAAFVALS